MSKNRKSKREKRIKENSINVEKVSTKKENSIKEIKEKIDKKVVELQNLENLKNKVKDEVKQGSVWALNDGGYRYRVKEIIFHDAYVRICVEKPNNKDYKEYGAETFFEKFQKIEPIFCKNCRRFYSTGADQCEVPACGLIEETTQKRISQYCKSTGISESEYAKKVKNEVDEIGQDFIKCSLERLHFTGKDSGIDNFIYGHPTQLNKDNGCYFFTPSEKHLEELKKIENKKTEKKKSIFKSLYERFLRKAQ